MKMSNVGSSSVPTNYYAAALDTTINGNFYMGKPNFQYGSRTLNGQLLLSNYVAENASLSDQFDDISLAAINLKGKGFPNNVPGCSQSCYQCPESDNQYGDMIVENAARMKYCVYPSGSYYQFPYNPTDPNSPILTQIIGSNTPVCTVDPSTIENDPLMNKILEAPEKHTNLLANIYKNTSGLEGTRLGAFYNDNIPYFTNYKTNMQCNYP